MTKTTIGFIILGAALVVAAPLVLIYFVGTHEASVDPIISKIGMIACAHPENFAECSEEFIELARETLEVREERINRWLYGIASFLGLVTWFFTALATLVAFGGVFGLWQFRNLRDEAKEKLKELDEWNKKSKKYHDNIEIYYNAAKKYYDGVSSMKETTENIAAKSEENLEVFQRDSQIAFKKIEDILEQADAIRKLLKKASTITPLLNMANKSTDNIITLEETARGLETEIREIHDSLKNSPKKE